MTPLRGLFLFGRKLHNISGEGEKEKRNPVLCTGQPKGTKAQKASRKLKFIYDTGVTFEINRLHQAKITRGTIKAWREIGVAIIEIIKELNNILREIFFKVARSTAETNHKIAIIVGY